MFGAGRGSRGSVAFGAFFSEVGAVRVRAVCRVTEPLVARYPYQKPRIVCQFETTSVRFGRVRVVQSRSALCGDFAISLRETVRCAAWSRSARFLTGWLRSTSPAQCKFRNATLQHKPVNLHRSETAKTQLGKMMDHFYNVRLFSGKMSVRQNDGRKPKRAKFGKMMVR